MPLHEHDLAHRLCSDVLAATQTTICRAIAEIDVRGQPAPRLLDIGCWEGAATLRYGAGLGAQLHGIEVFPEPADVARQRGISVAMLDLETGRFPWGPGEFDLIVANQVFEHLKNIWLPLSEVHRVLRLGGHFIISVPNLASLHNRVLLALGQQPTSIRTLGVHVRGYTLAELIGLVTLRGAFAVRAVHGVGFYPLNAELGRPFARIWPGGSHTIVLVVQKTADMHVSPWQEFRQQEVDAGVQTFYG